MCGKPLIATAESSPHRPLWIRTANAGTSLEFRQLGSSQRNGPEERSIRFGPQVHKSIHIVGKSPRTLPRANEQRGRRCDIRRDAINGREEWLLWTANR